MPALTDRFTLQLTPAMREKLDRRAALEERTAGKIVRLALAAYLHVEDDAEEPATDRTPSLPGIP